MHKYIRKYQDKNGKWVYVYHEHGLSPKNMTINEFPQTTAKEPSIPVIEHAEHEVEECITKAFESYLDKKMRSKGLQNNYLVGDDKLTGGIYPSEQVVEKLEPLFDKFFKTIKNTDLLKKFEMFWAR